MSEDAKKKISIIGLIGIFLTTFGYMADMAIMPAANAIFEHFSEAPEGTLNFILSGTQIVMVVVAILTIFLMRRIDKRYLLIFFFAIFTVGSCCGRLIDNASYVAAMRAVVGCGAGGLQPISIAMLSQIYMDNQKKSGIVVGAYEGLSAIMGSIMSIVSGFLVVGGWTHAFDIYYAAIPMLIIVIMFVPKCPPIKDEMSQEALDSTENEQTKSSTGRVVLAVLSAIYCTILYCTFNYMVSIYVAETGLGDSVFAGLCTSITTLVTGITAIFFGFIFMKMKRFSAPLMYALLALGIFGLSIASSQAIVIICYIILGAGYGFIVSYFFVYVGVIVPPAKTPTAVGCISAGLGFGAFLCTYVSTWIMQIFNIPTYANLASMYAILLVVGLVVSIVLAIRCKRLKLDNYDRAIEELQ